MRPPVDKSGKDAPPLRVPVPLHPGCKEQCQVHAGEEDHARPGWTTSRPGQDSPWKSQSEYHMTEIKWRK